MTQSGIIKAVYEELYKNLTELGEKTKLFKMSDEGLREENKTKYTAVCLGISDICQISPDKNGRKVEIDEMTFEAPVNIGCMLFITVFSKFYQQLLEIAGLLIQHFKDNNIVVLNDYKWHGETDCKIVLEPVIRKPRFLQEAMYRDSPSITLEYQFELCINSLKGTPFKRVEKRDIRGEIL